MRIKDIIKETQPKELKKLDKLRKKDELSESEIRELMSNRVYKRKNGALRQVR
ncbi:hypothetical protein QTH11_03505 [Clostridium perfringens]|uniref:Uncharacterized protein n=1 Tax=Clostridium perfringens TaxID=1502 RepID=A0AAN3QZB1_CLOPF|nr:hypothetical protein [Clostridium perfringens]EHK2327348.1 hypothetical protein [Clostridium perfringens]EHK2406198.1 hypothetical protein [Clostridium perfringens]MDH2334581.1 hypothetical protein [Clostridium perfringens]MDK0626402.1 hypothetical protein [Clostridium perfringens]MDK0630051.1 hypothetical protein [Clostridium perfringens]